MGCKREAKKAMNFGQKINCLYDRTGVLLLRSCYLLERKNKLEKNMRIPAFELTTCAVEKENCTYEPLWCKAFHVQEHYAAYMTGLSEVGLGLRQFFCYSMAFGYFR